VAAARARRAIRRPFRMHMPLQAIIARKKNMDIQRVTWEKTIISFEKFANESAFQGAT
jgi:hypothetical protein